MKRKTIRAHLGASFAAQQLAAKTVQLSAEAGAVEVVLLPYLPASGFTTNPDVDSRSGRMVFNYDQAGLVSRYNASGRKVNLNIEHNRTGDTRSRGYVYALTYDAMEPGLGMEPGMTYAWCVLSELGKQEMRDRLWLYTSAELAGVWQDETNYLITKAIGHALTNTPATEMPMNLAEESDEDIDAVDIPDAPSYTQEQSNIDDEMLKKILEALGLTAEATEEVVLSKLATLTQPAAAEQALTASGFTVEELTAGALVKTEALTAVQAELSTAQTALATTTEQLTAATAQVETLSAELATAKTELQTLTAAAFEAKLTAAVDSVITSRKATPAQRESLMALARADIAAFEQAFSAAQPVLSTDPVHVASGSAHMGLTAEDLAAAKAAGVSPESYAKARAQARAQLGL